MLARVYGLLEAKTLLTFAHYCVVKDGGTHPYQSIVLDSGSVDGHVVPHGYVVSYLYGRFLVQGVEHASILDVYSVPYAD